MKISVENFGLVYKGTDSWKMVGYLLWVLFVLLGVAYYGVKYGHDRATAVSKGLYHGTLVYCLIVVPSCWRIIRGNTVVLYQNVFRALPDPVSDPEAANTLQTPIGQIGFNPGLQFIPPWFRPIKQLSLETTAKLEETVEIMDQQGQDGTIEYFAMVTRTPGTWAPNAGRISDEFALPFLKSQIQGQIQEHFKRDVHDIIEEMQNMQELNEWSEAHLLNGSGDLSDPERRVGRYTWQIVLKKLKLSDSTAKIAVAKRNRKAISDLRKEFIVAGMELDEPSLIDLVTEILGIDYNFVQTTIRGMGAQPNPIAASEVIGQTVKSAVQQGHANP